MTAPQSGNKPHVCIVNVGLFRSGTTTLTKAAEELGMKTYREFPSLSPQQYRDFLNKPKELVGDWFSKEGLNYLIHLAATYDIICDGWITLLPFLQSEQLVCLKKEARSQGVHLCFVATIRDIESTVQSELQHWTVHDLEQKAGLSAKEREHLEQSLRHRAIKHQDLIDNLQQLSMLDEILPLEKINGTWSSALSHVTDFTNEAWSEALSKAGRNNANPALPVEGILLTLRLGHGKEADKAIAAIERLLSQIEEDSLCRYLVVLGLDSDEADGDAATDLVRRLESRARSGKQLQSFHLVINQPKETPDAPFPICSVWNEMAAVGWKEGADWVILLGDDIVIQCPFHYRAVYRSFLDIAKRLKVPFGFGCPWLNDKTFPGFPTFPCVGKAHWEVFESLIPEHLLSTFVNQDLDPYLHQLYVKFFAAPCVSEALLFNGAGGHIGSGEARYKRIPAKGWQDFALQDTGPIREYLARHGEVKEAILLDVVIPSYRVRLDYLRSICWLKVPDHLRTIFIVIVDNTDALLCSAAELDEGKRELTLDQAERILEAYLSRSGNTVRVRSNLTNVGASASRNRGLDESAAEFVLNIDDDLTPNKDLLEQYSRKLQDIEKDSRVVGLVGLVRFPRKPNLPLHHAAVLMSYLTFMFEIAEREGMYQEQGPAWGVTANILFRRSPVRFDHAYAKTGGGEDVDYALHVTEALGPGGKLIALPEACVVHDFWPGSVVTLASHFFNWAIGDGALFTRHPQFRYWSFPNLPETLFVLSPLVIWRGPWFLIITLFLGFFLADFAVDASNRVEYKHRCLQLQEGGANTPKYSSQSKTDKCLDRSPLFFFVAHMLANLYVVVLECGRLWGFCKRMEPHHGFSRRFDWHCGRLEKAPGNFRKREAYKFGLFVVVLAIQLVWLSWQRGSIDTCLSPQ